MKKIAIVVLIVSVIVLIFLSLSKKEEMQTVIRDNLSQKPLKLKLNHLQDPECKMVVEKEEYATQVAAKDGRTWVFDDIGCMVKWLESKKFEKEPKIWVFTLDTHSWIEAKDAFFSTDEITPMRHGFGAYSKKREGFISFQEVKERVLRGEDMTNPLIRKKILKIVYLWTMLISLRLQQSLF
jgi:hypothetical protein